MITDVRDRLNKMMVLKSYTALANSYFLIQRIMARKNTAAIRIRPTTRKKLAQLYVKTGSWIYLETYEDKITFLIRAYQTHLLESTDSA